VSETTVLWVGAQTSTDIDSRAPSGGVANSGRRLRSFTFDNGAPDPGTRSYEEQNALFRRGRFGNPARGDQTPAAARAGTTSASPGTSESSGAART
jgi:hypothetical protein